MFASLFFFFQTNYKDPRVIFRWWSLAIITKLNFLWTFPSNSSLFCRFCYIRVAFIIHDSFQTIFNFIMTSLPFVCHDLSMITRGGPLTNSDSVHDHYMTIYQLGPTKSIWSSKWLRPFSSRRNPTFFNKFLYLFKNNF